jgi:hypothetical protein
MFLRYAGTYHLVYMVPKPTATSLSITPFETQIPTPPFSK